MSVGRLILGTAGLGGLPYGRNQRVVGEDEAKGLINYALERGIRSFDTAPAYGQAEQWLGECLGDLRDSRFIPVYTKTTGDRETAVRSLRHLAPIRPVFLYHNWTPDTALKGWEDGVSTYSENVFAAYLKRTRVIQAEWNILRQTRFLRPADDDEFIARSVFMQGVLAGEPAPSPKLAGYVRAASEFADTYDLSLPALALRAALEIPGISKVVIGPTTVDEMKLCISIAKMEPIGFGRSLSMLDARDDACTDPRTWS